MKKLILERYPRTLDKKLIIEINAGKVEDLYDDFDKHAPYVRKELDQDLVDYIVDAVQEISREDFIIQFRLNTKPDESLTSRVIKSVHNYFRYLKQLEKRELAKMSRTSIIFFFIGFVILSLSVWINKKFINDESIFSHIITEGLTVAAWVALWNAIATFFINWAPRRRKIKMYERISQAHIHFHGKEADSQ